MTDRFYSFCICTYHTDVDIINDFCSKTFKFAYILHDKDENKSPHYHIVCSFKRNMSFSAVRKLFPLEQNTLVQQMFDKVSSFEYLTHKNNPEKYQYSDDLVKTNDLKYFVGTSSETSKLIERQEFFDDLAYHNISEKDLFLKYGRDYIKNQSVYRKFVNSCLKQDFEIMRGYPDGIDLIPYDVFQFTLDTVLSASADTQLVCDDT